MKNSSLLFLFIFFNTQSIEEVSIQKTALETQTQRFVLLKNSVKHYFSDSQKEDTFLLTLEGNSLLNSKVIFKIIDFKGAMIYMDTFSSKFLLGFTVEISDPTTKKMAFIQKRVKEFFSQENFLKPAINKNDTLDPDYTMIDKEIWKELQSDANKTGFYYLVGEENGRRIAYSNKLKKVLVYFSCC